ncbi:MAG: queuosine salvage family protein [Candidatus Levyibacteriota bacterium]
MLRLAAENDPLQVLSSTKFLVEEAKFVTINEDAIDMLLPQIQKRFAQGLDHITREKTLGSYEKDVQLNASSLSGLKEKNISNLDKLTAFADYKIPQMLRHFGVTSYADSLAQKVDSYILVQAESREELEIRASTIWASELLSFFDKRCSLLRLQKLIKHFG